MAFLLTLLACTPEAVDPPVPTDETGLSHTGEPAPVEVVDMATYLQACERELGPLPAFSCADAVEVPITVTDASGTRVVTALDQLEDGFRCDRSSIGGCAPYTRIGATTNARGSNLVFGCRNYGADPAFDQINAIFTSPTTGATCFFSTRHRDEVYGDGANLPRPGSDADLAFSELPFWYTLDDLRQSACVECHDNDAILHNPWVRQVDVLPVGGPLAPYWRVAEGVLADGGSPFWATPSRDLIHPATAPCRQCHRLSERHSCVLAKEATGREPRGLTTEWFRTSYPENRWMSTFDHDELLAAWPTEAAWEAAWGEAADAIDACCSADPPAGCFAP
ncbi:MAG: hypothetical protein R3F61_18035 [Myxococcota bacterium]